MRVLTQGHRNQGGQGNSGRQEREGLGSQSRDSLRAESSLPLEDFSNVLAPVGGGRRGLIALGDEPPLSSWLALGWGGRGWSFNSPPEELRAILNQQADESVNEL